MGTSVGFEEDLSYPKDFFGAASGAENSVFSAMSNLLFLGAPGRIRSYIVIGVGLIRPRVSLNQTSVNSDVIGYDVGGGVNGFFTKRVGIRGDVRHFDTFQDVNVLLVSAKLGFWRASLGLAVKTQLVQPAGQHLRGSCVHEDDIARVGFELASVGAYHGALGHGMRFRRARSASSGSTSTPTTRPVVRNYYDQAVSWSPSR